MNKIKIGLLSVRSALAPRASLHMQEGLKLALDEKKISFELIAEDGGNGTIARTKDKLEKLLLVDFVDVVIANISPQVAVSFDHLFREIQGVMLLIEAGAVRPFTGDYPDWLFSNSMMCWQLNAALGAWLVKNRSSKIKQVSSFYDAANDQNGAFQMGVKAAGGEVVLQRLLDEYFDERELAGELFSETTDVIQLNCTGEKGRSLALQLSQKGPDTLTLPDLIYRSVDPMPLQQSIAQTIPWHKKLKHPENKEFLDNCRAKGIDNPNIFHVQGYETGLWLSLAQAKGDVKQPAHFHQFSISGPRGPIGWDHTRKLFKAPLYVYTRSPEGKEEIEALCEEPLLDACAKALDVKLKSGLLTPYLFIT